VLLEEDSLTTDDAVLFSYPLVRRESAFTPTSRLRDPSLFETNPIDQPRCSSRR
jgi:hypothetical protein